MPYYSQKWLAFLDPATGEVIPVYIESWEANLQECFDKYGDRIPVDRHSPDTGYETEEACRKAINEYNFEQGFSAMFQASYVDPLFAAIRESTGEPPCWADNAFVTTYRDELALYTFAKNAWKYGFEFRIELAPMAKSKMVEDMS